MLHAFIGTKSAHMQNSGKACTMEKKLPQIWQGKIPHTNTPLKKNLKGKILNNRFLAVKHKTRELELDFH
jgi:hypothetical protein